MIKAIIFDFFGVLVTEGFKQFCETYFPGDQTKRRQAIELVNAHDSGRITMKQFYDGLSSLAGVDYDAAKAINNNQPNTQLLNYIKQEIKGNYKLGVLSNSGDDYINWMLDPKDVQLFDDVVLSYKHGMIKPDPGIFELAAERLGVEPSQCIFVDDSVNHTEGATKVGMTAIRYQTFAHFKKDYESLIGSNN